MLAETDLPDASPSLALSPARAVLSAAISALHGAQDRLEELHSPLSALERILLAAQSVEAAELRNEISRLLTAQGTEMNISVDRAASAERPLFPRELVEAEQRLANFARGAADAEHRVAAAREEYVSTAERVRIVLIEREEALWPAVIEATEPDMCDLEDAVRKVLIIEARLRGVVSALREIGHRGEPGGNGAFIAAERIETKIADIRQKPTVAVDIDTGRSMIDRLRLDPGATL
jgi:hypothetical protein